MIAVPAAAGKGLPRVPPEAPGSLRQILTPGRLTAGAIVTAWDRRRALRRPPEHYPAVPEPILTYASPRAPNIIETGLSRSPAPARPDGSRNAAGAAGSWKASAASEIASMGARRRWAVAARTTRGRRGFRNAPRPDRQRKAGSGVTPPDPRRGLRETGFVRVVLENGQRPVAGKWLVTSWQIGASGMTHELSRVDGDYMGDA